MSASSSRVPLSPFATHSGDAVVEPLDGGVLDLQVGLELLGDGLADAQREQPLHVGDALEVEDPVDQRLGVLHLVDRLVADVLGEPLVAPVVAHLGVDEVLVDRRQLGGEHLVEQLDDLVVTLHGAIHGVSPSTGPVRRLSAGDSSPPRRARRCR